MDRLRTLERTGKWGWHDKN